MGVAVIYDIGVTLLLKLAFRTALSAAVLWTAGQYLPGLEITDLGTLAIISVVIGLLNFVI